MTDSIQIKYNSIKDYCINNYEAEEIREICSHGMASGCANPIYYSETKEFYNLYEEEIWELLEQESDEHGCSPIEFISTCLKGKDISNLSQFKNTLCWHAIERACYLLLAEKEEPNNE